MFESVSAAGLFDEPERFERIGVAADGQTAARIRDEFARWLGAFFDLDPTRSSDLLLATNEALANAAEFAYLAAGRPGTMDVSAHYRADDQTLAVTIADRGTWRPPNTTAPERARGRGIPLMEALTDRATIDISGAGTQVRLEWTGVASRSQPSGLSAAN
jgi:serine/threonine-protein kinase RsbW